MRRMLTSQGHEYEEADWPLTMRSWLIRCRGDGLRKLPSNVDRSERPHEPNWLGSLPARVTLGVVVCTRCMVADFWGLLKLSTLTTITSERIIATDRTINSIIVLFLSSVSTCLLSSSLSFKLLSEESRVTVILDGSTTSLTLKFFSVSTCTSYYLLSHFPSSLPRAPRSLRPRSSDAFHDIDIWFEAYEILIVRYFSISCHFVEKKNL